MNLLRIKLICEEKKISIRSVAQTIGMSEQNLHKCIRENKIGASDLELIADYLNVSILTFFDEKPQLHFEGGNNQVHTGNGNQIIQTSEQQEIIYLNKLIAEKEKAIEDKDKMIQFLMDQSKK